MVCLPQRQLAGTGRNSQGTIGGEIGHRDGDVSLLILILVIGIHLLYAAYNIAYME